MSLYKFVTFLFLFLPILSLKRIVATIPKFDHIVVVIEENHSYDQVIGSPDMPYLNLLARNGAIFTKSFGVTHPSLPNYLALFSGSTQGVKDDNYHQFNAPNLGTSLIKAKKTFVSYCQSLPYIGFTGNQFGLYYRKHNPSIQFTNLSKTTCKPFSQLPRDFTKLPSVSFIIPNICKDAHSCNLKTADNWLQTNLCAYAYWAKTHNSLLIITFDEAFDNTNRIPTIFFGAHIKIGKYAQVINHYNILRTIEECFNLPFIGESSKVKSITSVWK